MSQQDPWEEALDLWDCLGIFASVVFPPLVVLAIAQWFIRRSTGYQRWTEHVRRSLSTRSEGSPALPEPRQEHPGTRGAPLLPSPVEDRRLDLMPHLLDQKHILLVGHTGGGKTTLLHAVAREAAAQGHHVLVCDPDAIQGRYPGYRCLGAGDDYGAIARALESVQAMFARRSAARAAGQREFAPAWVLVDEAQEVIAEIPGAWAILEQVIRRGRKLHLHCVIGSQDSQVRTLGLEGKSHLLVNLTRVDVMREAGRRVARVGETTRPVPDLPNPDDTVTPDAAVLSGLLQTSPDQSRPVRRPVRRPVQTSPDQSAENHARPPGYAPDDDPSDHQSSPVPCGSPAPSPSFPRTSPDQSADQSRPVRGTLPDHQAIRAKLTELGSKNKVWEWLKTYQPGMGKGRALDLINAALQEDSDDEAPPPPFRSFFGDDEGGRKAA